MQTCWTKHTQTAADQGKNHIEFCWFFFKAGHLQNLVGNIKTAETEQNVYIIWE